MFDLQAELEKLKQLLKSPCKRASMALGDSRLLIGDSTIEADVLKLMNGEKSGHVLYGRTLHFGLQ